MKANKAPPAVAPEAATVAGSGAASADRGGVGNSGVMGPVTVHHHPQPVAPTVWPVLVGGLPGLASAFQPRQGLRDQVTAARGSGVDVVLTQRKTRQDADAMGTGTRVLTGGGGIGKSQLACGAPEPRFGR